MTWRNRSRNILSEIKTWRWLATCSLQYRLTIKSSFVPGRGLLLAMHIKPVSWSLSSIATAILSRSGRNRIFRVSDDKKKLISPLKLLAGAGAAVTATVIGSFFGDEGTLIGVATGSVVSGAAAALYEHAAVKAHEKAKKRQQLLRQNRLSQAETVILSAVGRSAPRRSGSFPRQLVKGAAAGTAACLALIGGVTVAEALSGHTLHGLITGTNDQGYSVGTNHSQPPSPTITVTVAPAATWSISSPSATPSLLPSVLPSVSLSSSSSPSPTPTVVPLTSPTQLPATSSPVPPEPAMSSGLTSPPFPAPAS